MAKPLHKPGQIADDSGQYPLVGPRGGEQGREVTVVKEGSHSPQHRSLAWATDRLTRLRTKRKSNRVWRRGGSTRGRPVSLTSGHHQSPSLARASFARQSIMIETRSASTRSRVANHPRYGAHPT